MAAVPWQATTFTWCLRAVLHGQKLRHNSWTTNPSFTSLISTWPRWLLASNTWWRCKWTTLSAQLKPTQFSSYSLICLVHPMHQHTLRTAQNSLLSCHHQIVMAALWFSTTSFRLCYQNRTNGKLSWEKVNQILILLLRLQTNGYSLHSLFKLDTDVKTLLDTAHSVTQSIC